MGCSTPGACTGRPAALLRRLEENAGWQSALLRQLQHADALLLTSAPGDNREWSVGNRAYVLAHFRFADSVEGAGRAATALWLRTSS